MFSFRSRFPYLVLTPSFCCAASKVVLLTLMFSSAMPFLFIIVGLYCWGAHFVDKYLLFRVLRKPPTASSLRLMYILVCWLMPLAVLFRLGFAVFVYCERSGIEHATRPALPSLCSRHHIPRLSRLA